MGWRFWWGELVVWMHNNFRLPANYLKLNTSGNLRPTKPHKDKASGRPKAVG